MSETASLPASARQLGLQTVPDPFNLPSFALDPDGTVIPWDSQIAELLGVPEDELVTRRMVSEA